MTPRPVPSAPDKSRYRSVADLLRDHAETRGVGAGGRVAVLTDNRLEMPLLYFALQRYGAAFCTINVEVNAANLREMLTRIGAGAGAVSRRYRRWRAPPGRRRRVGAVLAIAIRTAPRPPTAACSRR